MYTNVNLSAPIGALLLLGTAVLLLALAAAFIFLIVKRKFGPAKFALGAFIVINAAYLVVLLVFSVTSKDRLLARGEEKHFCETDCHLAYSVTDVRDVKTVGEGANQISASGIFRVVTIKTRFDDKTTGQNRGNSLLYPNSRVAMLSDENGHHYFPSADAWKILDKAQQAGSAMTLPLRPGESYSTVIVFDVPADIKNAALLLKEGESLTHFVIGHENSPLHKKTRFQI